MSNRALLLFFLHSLRSHTRSKPSLFSISPKFYLFPLPLLSPKPSLVFSSGGNRGYAQGRVNLVLGNPPHSSLPRFETIEPEEPSVREKYKTKKRLKEQRKRERRKRREASRTDPRRIRPPKGLKKKSKGFPDAVARIKYKIDKAKIKESMLIEKLKKYEVPKVQGPMLKPEELTGEERFYMKKMAQKRSNYVPVGRRGVFGGVILNMHLHWKKHETVKVVCKPCKPGQVQEYATEIARLSGGTPIQIIGDDTIIFYRGKHYAQPEVMSPIDTLSKKKALEKSKYEQSLESVRRFIAIAEKELELYYRHIALYGDPNSRNSDQVYGDGDTCSSKLKNRKLCNGKQSELSNSLSNKAIEADSGDEELLELEALEDSNEDRETDLSDAIDLIDDEMSIDLSDSALGSDDEVLESDMTSGYHNDFPEVQLTESK